MTIIPDRVMPTSDAFRANRELCWHNFPTRWHADPWFGGPKYVASSQRTSLFGGERVEALLDIESLPQLSPLPVGTDFPVGAGVVVGIVWSGTECLIRPTIRPCVADARPDDNAQVVARLQVAL